MSPCALDPGAAVGQVQNVFPRILRVVRVLGLHGDADKLLVGAGRDDSEGTQSAPSLHLPRGGSLRLRIAVDAGNRSVSVKAKQPDAALARPTLRVLPNAEVGVQTELLAVAPVGAGWVKIGPITFTATTKGGVEVQLTADWRGGLSGCWFDSLIVT